MALAINIEPASPIAIHRQIYEAWRRGILSGRFAAGDRLPSTRELAVTLAVSRSTVSQAYEQLISEGYLQAARGSGTFVCRDLPDRSPHAQVAVKLTPHRAAPPPLSRYGSGLSDDYPHEPCRAGFVCFSQWGPDLVQFPWMLWRRTLSRHLRQTRHDVFDYAQQVEGYEPLRREIAAYVSRSRAVNCTPSQVIVVNGSQQGLDLCGLICGDLGRGARVVYVTPSHQYPTGVAMSLNRRLELLAWARRQSAVIIEDDYDSEYRYSGSPLPALQGLAQEVPVVYCGTFSKVMFPSLRIGYLIVPDNLVPAFTRAKRLADNYTPILEQIALRDFIAGGHLARHIRRMRRLYGSRREALLEALKRHFGECATVHGEAAGMHAFVRIEDKALRERAERNKVQLRSAQPCFLEGSDVHHYLFGFASLTERAIRNGIRRIAGRNA